MMLRTINPTSMTEDDCNLLDSLISQCTSNPIKIKDIKLTHKIIKRPCNPKGKNKNQFRYEIVRHKRHAFIGQGGFASVFQTTGTFVPSLNGTPAHYKAKERVYKLFSKRKNSTSILAEREYELTPLYLKMKPPVEIDKGWCLFMRKLEGELLFDIINFSSLSFNERLLLCIALSDAVHHQVHRLGIVHCDLKPDNIIVKKLMMPDQTFAGWEVNIFDFGLSKYLSENDKANTRGTPLYVSPEVRGLNGSTTKSDIYALACIFSEIFGCDRMNLIQSFSDIDAEVNSGSIFLKGLFSDMKDINANDQEKIICLLKRMSNYMIWMRPTAKETASELRKLSLFQPRAIANTLLSPASDMPPSPAVNPSI